MSNFLSLTPNDQLVFQLFFQKSVSNSLEIKNISTDPLTFKIKTTNPSRYLVKPSQGVLAVNETKTIHIAIVPKEVSILVEQGVHNCNDKFLVQSTIIDESTFDDAVNLDFDKQNEFLSKLWTNAQENVSRQKIQVRVLPPNDQIPLSAEESAEKSDQIKGETDASSGSEFMALQKKYENLMNITANIVSERDQLKKIIENLKTDLHKESTARIALESQNTEGIRQGRRNKMGDELESSNSRLSQFSLFSVILVAIVFFLIGRMM